MSCEARWRFAFSSTKETTTIGAAVGWPLLDSCHCTLHEIGVVMAIDFAKRTYLVR
jgi:hypothetical protein